MVTKTPSHVTESTGKVGTPQGAREDKGSLTVRARTRLKEVHKTAQQITAHFVTHFRASFITATTMYLMGEAFPLSSPLHSGSRAVDTVIICSKRHRSRERPSHCNGRVLVGCQGKRLTDTSACDLGVVCHVGLFMVHAVIAKGLALPQQAHACTRFVRSFLSFSTVDDI